MIDFKISSDDQLILIRINFISFPFQLILIRNNFISSIRQMTNEDLKVSAGERVCQPQVHVSWWDNFSNVYGFQKADMSRTNFTLCLWTVVGVQRQSLPSQKHVVDGDHGSSLMNPDDFKVSANVANALPDDITSAPLLNVVKNAWFKTVGRTRSFWVGNFRARNVTRVPLKLPKEGKDDEKCGQCDGERCTCALERLVNDSSDAPGDILNLASSSTIDDHISGSPDGLLNFFPFELRRFNIGSKIGLARMLADSTYY